MVRSPPAHWMEEIPALAGRHILAAAGYAQTVDLGRVELEGVYLPVLAMLEHLSDQGRVLAGLAGIPGGGKSVWAAALAVVAERLLPGQLVILGMDGWHWPNAELERRTTCDAGGRAIPLRRRKGGPESYDVEGLVQTLQGLQGRGEVRLPAYDRRLHEPVADALRIDPAARIVLLEGNYVLGGVPGYPRWDAVAERLAAKFLLECDPQVARERVIARHIHGGLTRAEAEAKYDANDRLNAELVLATAGRADFVIRRSPPGGIANR